MKLITKFFLSLLIAAVFSTAAMASTGPEKSSEKTNLRSEVLKHLKNTTIHSNNVEATLTFTVNSQNEIVVLSVKTNDKNMESIVKHRLNYKPIRTKLKKTNQTYHIDLTFRKK